MDLVLTQVGLDAVATRWAGQSLPSLVTRVNLGSGQWTPTRQDSALQAPLGLSLEVVGKQTDDNVLTVNLQDIDPDSAYDCYEIAVMIDDGTQEVPLALASSMGTPLFSKVQGGQLGLSFSLGAEAGLDLEALTVETAGFQWTPATPTVRGVDYAYSVASAQSTLNSGIAPRTCKIFVRGDRIIEEGIIDLRPYDMVDFRWGCQIKGHFVTTNAAVTIAPYNQANATYATPRAWPYFSTWVRFMPAGLDRFFYKIESFWPPTDPPIVAQYLADSLTDSDRYPSLVTYSGAFERPSETGIVTRTDTLSSGAPQDLMKVNTIKRKITINLFTLEVFETQEWEFDTAAGFVNPFLGPSLHSERLQVTHADLDKSNVLAWDLDPSSGEVSFVPATLNQKGIFFYRYVTDDPNAEPSSPWRH